MVDAKMHKNADFCVTIQNFSGGYAPDPPCWGLPTVPLLIPISTARCAPSVPRSGPQ